MDRGSKEGVKPWVSQTDSDWDGRWRKQGAKSRLESRRRIMHTYAFQPGSPTCMPSYFSHVQLFATRLTVACQAPLSMEFSIEEYWSG